MNRHYLLIILTMILSRLEIMSQSIPDLTTPSHKQGSVRLNISAVASSKAEESDYLAAFVKNEAEDYHSNAIQGRYQVEGDFLVFTPYYPFENGLTYVARVKDFQAGKGYLYHHFQVGEKLALEKAKLLSIYPSADVLPENLLRFYFYFNTPMKKGQALTHIELVDDNGNVDNRAFMEFKQELWSADGKRLTILFDPGRIKRGVSTNKELGPALLEGKKYTLNISGKWQDVYGQELSTSTTKEFVVGPAYRQKMVVEDWIIEKSEVKDGGLTIHFDRIMDHALVQSMIKIIRVDNQKISGIWETSRDEKKAQFTPEQPWQNGNYQIVFDPRMEDVAGNNMEGLLDRKSGPNDSENQQFVRHFSL